MTDHERTVLLNRLTLLYDPAQTDASAVFGAAVGAHAEVYLAIGKATQRIVGGVAMDKAFNDHPGKSTCQLYLNLLYEAAEKKEETP